MREPISNIVSLLHTPTCRHFRQLSVLLAFGMADRDAIILADVPEEKQYPSSTIPNRVTCAAKQKMPLLGVVSPDQGL